MKNTTEKFPEIETYGVEPWGSEKMPYRFRDLLEYCRNKGIETEDLTDEELKQFKI